MGVARGVIRNRDYATQVRDFSGLRFKNITPTDIDGLIEYHNLCFVLIETKYGDASLPFGQRLALERLCDAAQVTKPTIAIVATHNSDGDIDVANTKVVEYRSRGQWRIPKHSTSTRHMIDQFLKWVEKQDFR